MTEPSITIETRRLGEVAEEEIRAARDAGIDPLEIAETHATLARIIPHLLGQDSDDVPGMGGHRDSLAQAWDEGARSASQCASATGRCARNSWDCDHPNPYRQESDQ